MALGHSEEFKRDAVRIVLTSGLTRRHASTDLGVGMSTLNKWIKAYCDTDAVSNEDQKPLRGEGGVKKSSNLLRGGKSRGLILCTNTKGPCRKHKVTTIVTTSSISHLTC